MRVSKSTERAARNWLDRHASLARVTDISVAELKYQ
jgi:hypothetical protein